jgi:hypothetical protein
MMMIEEYNGFMNCIDEVDMNNVVGYGMVIIEIDHNCYCYESDPRNTNFIYVRKPNEHIYIIDLVKAMILDGYKSGCNHMFLEGFYKIPGSDIQFNACFGS